MRRLELLSLDFLSMSMRSNVTLFFGIILSLIESLNSNIVQISMLVATAPIIWGMTSLIMPRLMSKYSVYQIVSAGAWILAVSAALRLTGEIFTLFFFTLTLNIGIGILNIAIPAWVKQIAPNATEVLLSRHYKIMLLASGCSIIMSVVMLETGSDWKWAFAPWLVISLLGAGLLTFVPNELITRSSKIIETTSNSSGNRTGLIIFILFFGIQGISSQAFGAWAPTLIIDYGFTTLTSAIVCAILATMGAFLASKLLSQQLSQAKLQMYLKVASVLLVLGFLQLFSEQLPIFSLGLLLIFCSQSIIFLISLISIARWSNDVNQVLRVSLTVQGFGYVIAGFGPICVGLIRQSQGSWEACIFFMIICTLAQFVFGRKTLKVSH